ncbi:MAG: hypothetical protein WD772_12770 [Pseudohongiellaceae bacterium]
MKSLIWVLTSKNLPAMAGLRRQLRVVLAIFLLLGLQACNSGAAREAEMAAIESARIAAEQEAAQLAAEQARIRSEEEDRLRRVRQAEQARQDAERARQAELARIEAEQERQRQAEEQARLAAIARVQAERREKLDRVEQLEAQIVQLESEITAGNSANDQYRAAIAVAEELIGALATEQAKYDNVDSNGNTVEPLARELIAELEARKDALVRQAQTSTP